MNITVLKHSSLPIVLSIVIAMLITDTMINQVSDFLAPQLTTDFGIGLFTSFIIIFALSQYYLISYTMKKIRYHYSTSLSTRIMAIAIVTVQIFLVLINMILLAQILFLSKYYTYLLIIMTAVSYSASILLMSYSAYKFL